MTRSQRQWLRQGHRTDTIKILPIEPINIDDLDAEKSFKEWSKDPVLYWVDEATNIDMAKYWEYPGKIIKIENNTSSCIQIEPKTLDLVKFNEVMMQVCPEKENVYEEVVEFDYYSNRWTKQIRGYNFTQTLELTKEQAEEWMMAQEQKKKQGDEESNGLGGLNFELPKTKDLMQDLEEVYKEELRGEHKELQDEEDKKDKTKGVKKKKMAGGIICICGSPGCRIGPMEQKQGAETTEES